MKHSLVESCNGASSIQGCQQFGRSLWGAALVLGVPLFVGCAADPAAGAGAQETGGSAKVELTVSDPAVPLPVVVPQAPDPLFSGLTVAPDAARVGMWSATRAWPLNGLHSVLLPNGRVLTFGTPTGAPAVQDGRYLDVWDPEQGFGNLSHRTTYRAERVNSFCGAAAFLSDGRLLLSGGNSPLDSNEFVPADGSVTQASARLADDRWYGTMLTLADGRPIMLGGSTPYGGLRAYRDPLAALNAGVVSMTPEVFEPGVGWRSLFGAYSREAFGPDHHRYWYPRAWVAPNGELFGISSEKMWYLNPSGNGAIRVAGNFKTGVDPVTRPNIGPTSTAVMFAPGRVLQVGGNGYHDGHATPSSALATVVDINGQNPVLTETAAMHFPRQWPNATVLPDGRVVVTGGTRFGNNGGADAVYEAELWDPATGTWTVGPRAAQIRVYHSAAILMPSGVVLSTGGGAPGPVNNLNAEVYYPPYLFRAVAGGGAALAPRPTVTAISALRADYGATLELDLASGNSSSKVVLIGASSVTHSFNMAQRRLELSFKREGSRMAIAMPASPNEAPPGYYVLFVVDGAGVPANGVILAVGPGTAAPPVSNLLSRGSRVLLASVNLPDYVMATDAEGLGVLQRIGSTPTAADTTRAEFWVRDGLADSQCVSLEAAANPGQWLRHYAYRLRLGASDGSELFRNDATFCPEQGLSGKGFTLRSKNFGMNVLRHRSMELWIDPTTSDPAFALDATFTLRATPGM